MSRPVENFSRVLDEILSEHDLSHDFGRREAYEKTIEYARSNLAEHPQREEFLRQAASRLGFAPLSWEALTRRRLEKGAWIDVWISDDDDEVALTGTREGIQYLIDLLVHLRDTEDPEEHYHLDRGFVPMTDVSASLVLFREEEGWFTGDSGVAVPDAFPVRDLDPAEIHAIQFVHFPPEELPITANRLYRVTSVEKEAEPDTSTKELPGGEPGRYYRVTFRADEGEIFTYVFHLDDPGVNFFTHREIMALVLKSV
jgi:hypothetical protein